MEEVTSPARAGAKGLGKKLVLLAATLLFCFLGLELYVRATWQSQWHIPKDAVRTPGIFSARMKPDHESDIPLTDGGTFHVKTNSRGFRGPLVAEMAKKPLKILSLGDSYTFGWGMDLQDHCMTRFVTAYRAAHPERDVGHAYVACGSWDPKDYLFAYLTEAADARPDVVVLGIFTGNDVMPSTAVRLLDPAQAVSVEKLPEPPRPLFRSIDWLGVQLSSNLFAAQVGYRAKHHAAAFALFEPDLQAQAKLWDTTFFYVKAVNEAVRKNGGRLVILLYPSLLQVNTRKQLDASGYDHAMPEKVLAAFCQQNDIGLVTILDALEAKNQSNNLFFPKDRHLNAAGNRVAAEVLEAKLGPLIDRAWHEKVIEHKGGDAPPSPDVPASR
ncbi:MAG TPA: SGNH/GDSL hydrolase family protein [Polyangia bacterium]|jgi:hypothetical protein|nr:SGNH/GDSL hydrolase family protein [Polyangia bacterium]